MYQSSSIGLSCFMIDWFQLPTKTIHDLILIIAMSNSPIKISAGNIMDLSLYTFGGVSYYLILNFKLSNFSIQNYRFENSSITYNLFYFIGSQNITSVFKFSSYYYYVIHIL